MADLNTVALVGRLTRDPESRATSGGTTVTNFGIAVKDFRDETHFFDCKCFGKTAEFAGKYFEKGKPIALSGSLVLEQWESKEGQKRSKVTVVAERVCFVPASKDEGGSRGELKGGPKRPAKQETTGDGSLDDIPF